LTEAAQYPVLATILVIARNAHCRKQLLGHANLPVAMLA